MLEICGIVFVFLGRWWQSQSRYSDQKLRWPAPFRPQKSYGVCNSQRRVYGRLFGSTGTIYTSKQSHCHVSDHAVVIGKRTSGRLNRLVVGILYLKTELDVVVRKKVPSPSWLEPPSVAVRIPSKRTSFGTVSTSSVVCSYSKEKRKIQYLEDILHAAAPCFLLVSFAVSSRSSADGAWKTPRSAKVAEGRSTLSLKDARYSS